MFNLAPRPNRKVGIDLSDYCYAAESLNCPVSMIRAVDAVESAGTGYLPSGKPKILFEGHLFHKFTGGKFSNSHPTISYPIWTKKFYRGGEAEYRRLALAMSLDQNAALRATSWQRFQILGDNYEMCGFRSVEEFVEAMYLDEDNSLEAFVNFVRRRGLSDELRRKDADGFAYGYNGPSYRRNNYGVKIRNAERGFAKIKINCEDLTSTAPTPIEAVFPADCREQCVGLNNTSLDDRYLVSSLESDNTEAVFEQKANSNPTHITPPSDSPSTSGTTPKNTAQIQAGTSVTNDEGGSTRPSLWNFIMRFLDKVSVIREQIERVTGRSANDMLPRSDSTKSKATIVWTHIVQITLFVLQWALGIPIWAWALVAVLLGAISLAYMYRQTLLGLIRERNEQVFH